MEKLIRDLEPWCGQLPEPIRAERANILKRAEAARLALVERLRAIPMPDTAGMA